MKNKISVLLFALITAFMFTGCDEDEVEPFYDPSRLAIGGLHAVSPGTTHKFTVGSVTNPESYTWSVDGPAQIVGGATGATVTVAFQSVGDVVLKVTNGTDTGKLTVEVEEVEPAVTATLTGTGVLRSGQSDTVFFEFDAPVEEIGGFGINTADSTGFNKGATPFTSGTVGELVKVSDHQYYVIYTAGSGNGTAEVKFTDIVSTAAYGSVTIDSAYAQLYKVDNIAPVANMSYSATRANDGSTVTITATFTEAVMPANEADSVLFISVGGADRDTLVATANPLVYTYEYEVSGNNNGPVQVELENVADFAGHELAAVNNASELVVDNIEPVVVGLAVDNGSNARISITSSETGTGMYLILKTGQAAPADVEEFMAAEGVAKGSAQVTAGTPKVIAQALASGSYKVYYVAMDAAGNSSSITSTSLVMN